MSNIHTQAAGDLLVTVGSIVTGSVNVPGDLVVHGKVNGVVVAKNVLVGPTGGVMGKVTAENIVLEGYMSDDVSVASHIRLCASSKLVGHLNYGTVEIVAGAVIMASFKKTSRT